MENATKALLIAAAILIAIIIITIGVFVVNMGKEAVESVNMNEQEQLAFNSKFTSYEGLQRGSQINALSQTVLTNNQAAKVEGSTNTKGVKLNFGGTESVKANGESTSYTRANTGTYYNVKITYKNGLVNVIDVTEYTESNGEG